MIAQFVNPFVNRHCQSSALDVREVDVREVDDRLLSLITARVRLELSNLVRDAARWSVRSERFCVIRETRGDLVCDRHGTTESETGSHVRKVTPNNDRRFVPIDHPIVNAMRATEGRRSHETRLPCTQRSTIRCLLRRECVIALFILSVL